MFYSSFTPQYRWKKYLLCAVKIIKDGMINTIGIMLWCKQVCFAWCVLKVLDKVCFPKCMKNIFPLYVHE